MEPIADHEVDTFRERGWLVLPGMLGGDELAAMRADMEGLAGQARPGLEDFLFGAGHVDGSEVLRRIQYVVDKSPAARAMMGHPGCCARSRRSRDRTCFPPRTPWC